VTERDRDRELENQLPEMSTCAAVTVIFGVCGSVGLLKLLVVAIRGWPVDPVSNPEPRRETL
jgi:hypothetical protein